ncbi:hypothetical protein H4219_000750 [Mycoemilia scoparia]|uniref:Uncharacterized protein n=1 Tax=Mycoemilia scoparia TaxID=417184 RepID=A0A9W8DWU3_9FUNG|nr:hypothetical protein H4219_000750 [Mycoemilia scoparia]
MDSSVASGLRSSYSPVPSATPSQNRDDADVRSLKNSGEYPEKINPDNNSPLQAPEPNEVDNDHGIGQTSKGRISSQHVGRRISDDNNHHDIRTDQERPYVSRSSARDKGNENNVITRTASLSVSGSSSQDERVSSIRSTRSSISGSQPIGTNCAGRSEPQKQSDLDVLAMVTVTSPPLPDHSKLRSYQSNRSVGQSPRGLGGSTFPAYRSSTSTLNSYKLAGGPNTMSRVVPRNTKPYRSSNHQSTQKTHSLSSQKSQDSDCSDETISDDDETWRQRSARAHRRMQEHTLASLDDSGSDHGIGSPARGGGPWQSPTPGARISGPLTAHPPGSTFEDRISVLSSGRRGPTDIKSSPIPMERGIDIVSPAHPRLGNKGDFENSGAYNYGIKSAGLPAATSAPFSPTPNTTLTPSRSNISGHGYPPPLTGPKSHQLSRCEGGFGSGTSSHRSTQKASASSLPLEPIMSDGDTTETDEECASIPFSPVPRRQKQRAPIGSKTPHKSVHALSPGLSGYALGIKSPLPSSSMRSGPASSTFKSPERAGQSSRVNQRRPDPLIFHKSHNGGAPVAGHNFESLVSTPQMARRQQTHPRTEPIHRSRPRTQRIELDDHASPFDDKETIFNGNQSRGPRNANWKPSTPGYRFQRSGYESGDTTETDEELQSFAHSARALHYSVKPSRRIRRELAQIRGRDGEVPKPLQLVSPNGSSNKPLSGQSHRFAESVTSAFPPIVSSVRSHVASPSQPHAQQPQQQQQQSRAPESFSDKGRLAQRQGYHAADRMLREKRKRALTAPSDFNPPPPPPPKSRMSITDPSSHAICSKPGKLRERPHPSADDIGAAQALASLSPRAPKISAQYPRSAHIAHAASAENSAHIHINQQAHRLDPSNSDSYPKPTTSSSRHQHDPFFSTANRSNHPRFGLQGYPPDRDAKDARDVANGCAIDSDATGALTSPTVHIQKRRRSSTYTSGATRRAQGLGQSLQSSAYVALPSLPAITQAPPSSSGPRQPLLSAESEFPVLAPPNRSSNPVTTESKAATTSTTTATS